MNRKFKARNLGDPNVNTVGFRFDAVRLLHSDKWIKYATIGQTERIERIRWRLLERKDILLRRWRKLAKECFKFERVFAKTGPKNEELITLCFSKASCRGGGFSYHVDHEFLSAEGNALKDLAKVGAVTDESLRLGGIFWRNDCALQTTIDRIQTMNTLLEMSIKFLNFIPSRSSFDEERIVIKINNREYPFVVSYAPLGDTKNWPTPDLNTIDLPKFSIEESLGLNKETVHVRFGKPTAYFSTSRKRKNYIESGDIWLYGDKAIKFNDRQVVIEILTDKEIAILKSIKV